MVSVAIPKAGPGAVASRLAAAAGLMYMVIGVGDVNLILLKTMGSELVGGSGEKGSPFQRER